MEAEVKQVAISINGRDYDIACDDGQEEHLTRLAGFVDERVQELVSTVGNIGDMRLLVLTSLLIADELHENRRAREQEREERSQAGEQARIIEMGVANALDNVSDRIERLSARLENA